MTLLFINNTVPTSYRLQHKDSTFLLRAFARYLCAQGAKSSFAKHLVRFLSLLNIIGYNLPVKKLVDGSSLNQWFHVNIKFRFKCDFKRVNLHIQITLYNPNKNIEKNDHILLYNHLHAYFVDNMDLIHLQPLRLPVELQSWIINTVKVIGK